MFSLVFPLTFYILSFRQEKVFMKLHGFSRASIMHVHLDLDLGHRGLVGLWLASGDSGLSLLHFLKKEKKKSNSKEKSEGVTEKSDKNCRSVLIKSIRPLNPAGILSSNEPPERPNRFISCKFIEMQRNERSLQTAESNYRKPPAPFFIFIDKVALCWSWQQVRSWAQHSGRQRWLSIRNGIFVWSQNHCLSLNLSEVDANEADFRLAAPCEKKKKKEKINNSAPPALQDN